MGFIVHSANSSCLLLYTHKVTTPQHIPLLLQWSVHSERMIQSLPSTVPDINGNKPLPYSCHLDYRLTAAIPWCSRIIALMGEETSAFTKCKKLSPKKEIMAVWVCAHYPPNIVVQIIKNLLLVGLTLIQLHCFPSYWTIFSYLL